MRASWSWLRELVDVEQPVEEVARRLTFAGIEVEGIERLGEQFSGVVVAEVVERRPHPKADKLTLVTVTDGTGRHEVVCGASNVPAPGGRVLWARPGAKLPPPPGSPGGSIVREIGVKELKGIVSAGMICSETELGLGEDGAGIVVLTGDDAAAAPGTLAQDALGLRDVILEVNVTANRPDVLGHLGLAREIAALTGGRLKTPDTALDGVLADRELAATVSVEDPEGCPRYVARVIEGVKVGPSPRWLRRRLEAVGVRPISNLVDVTNLVMFELGHPLHAFDLDRLSGEKIVVRRARAGERMKTLDGQERALVAEDLLICDARGPVALAGVMGGLETEVSASTTRVLLEAATFLPRAIRRTAKRLGLHSEASHRFERGVDPNGVERASQRAARLLAEIGGGRVTRGAADVYPNQVIPRVVELRPARAGALLGVEIGTDVIQGHLAALELSSEPRGDRLRVSIPTFRVDLEREVDLIEEVARLHGLDRIPATLPRSEVFPQPSGDPLATRVRAALAAAGLDETISYGYTSPARIAALRHPEGHAAARPIPIANPMREEGSVMRTSLLPNLLAALARNLSFGVPDVRLFEVGSVFLPSGRQLPDEPRFVAGVMTGTRLGWLQDAGAVDFYDVKGVVERLFAELRVPVELVAARSEEGFLHPGVAASIVAAGERVGVVGELHPVTRERSGIDRVAFAFEVNLERLPPLAPARFHPIDRFPAIVRDLSFFVDEMVPAARVRELIAAGTPPILAEVRVLEDYREAGRVPPGKKGMLWSLTYRHRDRTLTDAEVDGAHEQLVSRLLAALSAERR